MTIYCTVYYTCSGFVLKSDLIKKIRFPYYLFCSAKEHCHWQKQCSWPSGMLFAKQLHVCDDQVSCTKSDSNVPRLFVHLSKLPCDSIIISKFVILLAYKNHFKQIQIVLIIWMNYTLGIITILQHFRC